MTQPTPTPGAFALGITEADPYLLAPGPWRAPYAGFHQLLARLRPHYVRVLVDWSHLQPTPAPPAFTARLDGCMRALQPCLPWTALRDTLRAIQRLGAQPVLVVYGTPTWAAEPVGGCARADPTGYRQMPDLGAYRRFVRALLLLGRSEGIDLPWWSPWNEPNVAGFLSPQRSDCDAEARPISPRLYVAIARAMAAELRAAPGDQRLLVGETAGVTRPRPKALSAAELAAALPDSLVCGAVWSEHAHLLRIRDGGRSIAFATPEETDTLLDDVKRALDGHGCARTVPIWITETGVGDVPGGCEVLGARLQTWARDERIRAVFQYTFREDPAFPVGLADAGLTRVFHAYGAWRTRSVAGCA